MEVLALEPHGFCEGVSRAYELAEKSLSGTDPVYALGLVVHNEKVIASLRKRGLISLDERTDSLANLLRSIPNGSKLLFSAHGHDPKLDSLAQTKSLRTIDSTCPFVKANMERMLAALGKGSPVIYIGEKGHLECEAALSLSQNVYLYEKGGSDLQPSYLGISGNRPYVVVQTTMDESESQEAFADIVSRFPDAVYAGGRCPSTIKRQSSIAKAPQSIDIFVILGSERSNNTLRLAALAKQTHPSATVLRVLDKNELTTKDLSSHKKAALASGASTDPRTYFEALSYLQAL
jgi:Penicillin tolerance protein